MEDGVPGEAYREREEEFDIQSVPYVDGSDGSVDGGNADVSFKSKTGILCVKWTDEEYVAYWGQERFEEKYTSAGIPTIWGWTKDSGLRPCRPYFRLCLNAAKGMGEQCYNSFLDETFLVDRTTTVRKYLEQYPEVIEDDDQV